MDELRPYDPAASARLLAVLGDGSPPFIPIAAARAGLDPSDVAYWLHAATTEKNPVLVRFLFAVRKVRADYIAQALEELSDPGELTPEALKSRRWVLERLEREMFSPPVARQSAKLAKQLSAGVPEAADPQELEDSLSAPEKG